MLMMEIVISQNENQNVTIENNRIQNIGITQNDTQNVNIQNIQPQEINLEQEKTQTILIDNGGVAYGITDVLVNGISVVSDGIAYVITPTKTSELINNSGFITSETDPTIPSYIKSITQADITSWNNKQNQLVSGVNIKTLNDESILGSGNIEIEIPTYTSGTGIDITNYEISNTITSYNDLTDLPIIPTQTSELVNDSDFVTSDELSDVAFSGSYTDLSNAPDIPTDTSDLINDSGFIDKDVNDLTYYTLTSNLSAVATSGDYDDLTNKPSIPTVNNATLTIQQNGTDIETFTANSSTNKTANITVPTKTSDLTNDSGYLVNSDSGWIDLTLLNGVTARDNTMTYKPQIRKINNVVYMKGQVNIPTTGDIIMCVIPDGYRPSFEAKMGNVNTNNWIDTSGNVNLSATNQLYFQSINTFWLIN